MSKQSNTDNIANLLDVDMPQRLVEALASQEQLNQAGIYFVPLRHHSPACAFALQRYIEQVRPTHIAIEAPDNFNPLIFDLLSSDTKPPVAIFAQAKLNIKNKKTSQQNDDDESDDEMETPIRSAYFPFCEYSPEWVALQTGRKNGADLSFIDLDWASHWQVENQLDLDDTNEKTQYEQKNLLQESYLAYSKFVEKIAQKIHCRDHDEVWEHLFELRPLSQLTSAQQFFNDVFIWCALSRLDYQEEELLRELNLHREYNMYKHICSIKENNDKAKIMVVTGGFHTLALIELLISHQMGKTVQSYQVKSTKKNYTNDAWLIRYSFDRLDGLNGYNSGMPSPAYYQQVWQDMNQQELYRLKANTMTDMVVRDKVWQDTYAYINQLCHYLDEKKVIDITPYIALKNTAEMAIGLANLRNHYRVSRCDLLDALRTALIKEELEGGQTYFWQCIREYLSGNQLGSVANTQSRPALLENTLALAHSFRFRLDDTIAKHRKLDIYRKKNHQKISQFLHLLNYLEIGFASRISGPDFINGLWLDLLFESWKYAWTPSVEARLIELSQEGDNLIFIASKKLSQEKIALEEKGQENSAEHMTKIFVKACQLGLGRQIGILEKSLDELLCKDDNLYSLVSAAQQLFYLWHGRDLFTLPDLPLRRMIILAIVQACYQLEQLYDTNEDKLDENVKLFKQLHLLIHTVTDGFSKKEIDLSNMPIKVGEITLADWLKENRLLSFFYENISIKILRQLHLSQMMGAFDAMLFLDKYIDQQEINIRITAAFAPGSLMNEAVAYLQGVFVVTPETFVQSDLAINALAGLVSSWNEDDFISVLPDLRFIFSQLTPKQSQVVAEKIAIITGLKESLNIFALDITETDMLECTKLNTMLTKLLLNDELQEWLVKGEVNE